MGRLSNRAGDKSHTRTIATSTFAVDATHILCTGRLTDIRHFSSFGFTGTQHEAGALHDLEIHILVSTPELRIEDVEVTIHTVPRTDCETLAHSLDAVIGLTISRGFSARVKSLAGGKDGCTHLVHLLTTMAPALLQGYWALVDRKKPTSKEARRRRAAAATAYLRDSCYTWREDGQGYRELLDIARQAREDATGI